MSMLTDSQRPGTPEAGSRDGDTPRKAIQAWIKCWSGVWDWHVYYENGDTFGGKATDRDDAVRRCAAHGAPVELGGWEEPDDFSWHAPALETE
jgi:hypothetical protein